MTNSPPASNESMGWLRGWLRDLWERGWLKGLLLVAAIFIAYQPAWHGGFIWDDDTHISDNETLRSLKGLWDTATGIGTISGRSIKNDVKLHP